MKIYFGQVPTEFVNDGEYFQDEKGDYFYYELEIEQDQFTISDTANRYMPFDRDSARELGTALFAVTSVYAAEDRAAKVFAQEMEQLGQLLQHFKDNPQ